MVRACFYLVNINMLVGGEGAWVNIVCCSLLLTNNWTFFGFLSKITHFSSHTIPPSCHFDDLIIYPCKGGGGMHMTVTRWEEAGRAAPLCRSRRPESLLRVLGLSSVSPGDSGVSILSVLLTPGWWGLKDITSDELLSSSLNSEVTQVTDSPALSECDLIIGFLEPSEE